MVNHGVKQMMKSAIASLSLLVMTANVYAGDIGQDDTVVRLGDPLSGPALAMIGAVSLIAGIRYLRNKRS